MGTIARFSTTSFLTIAWVNAALAASFSISDGGTSGTNQLWNISLVPNSAASAAVEMGIKFQGGSILSVLNNAAVFDRMNPGQNPFTGTITDGISIHSVMGTDDAAFASLGSVPLPSLAAVLVATVETNAAGTLTLGGQDHNGQFIGARVAQLSQNSDGLTASLTINPTTGFPADFDSDGDVDGDDLAQWQGDFGLNGDSDADNNGLSDGTDFLIWQRSFPSPASQATLVGVPEPASATGWLVLGLIGAIRRQRIGRDTCGTRRGGSHR
jgi:hypothetical protein